MDTIIGYGLATDCLCKPNGFPKDKPALAWLFYISESNLPGWMSMFEFILRKQAKKARQKGIDVDLIKKYVRFLVNFEFPFLPGYPK